MPALITKRKKPSVKNVIGIVKIVKIGLTTVFKKANTTATKSALIKSVTCTPGNNQAVNNTATADTSIFKMNLMWQNYPLWA